MIRLTRIDPILNMSRYYQIHIQPCLFGGCDLVREWGRIGSPGTVKTVIYDNQADAAAAVADSRETSAQARLSHDHRHALTLSLRNLVVVFVIAHLDAASAAAAYTTASKPLALMRDSSFRDGPDGRFCPRSHSPTSFTATLR